MRFRVKAGGTVEVDGKRYRKGELVDSGKDLTKLAPEKFEYFREEPPQNDAEEEPIEDEQFEA